MLLLVASHVPEPVQVPLPIAAALITLVVAVIGTWALAIYFSERSALQLGLGSRTQHAVIVTAHPDDECMFFAPTIATLRRHGVEVHLLCLSTGDYEGLGERRQQELVDSAAVLGIQPETVTCVDVPELQDAPQQWDAELVAAAIVASLPEGLLEEALFFSFDSYGISGHLNHQSVYRGLQVLVSSGALDPLQMWCVQSTNRLRKYSSIVDMTLSCFSCFASACGITRGPTLLAVNPSMRRVHNCMRAHRSQYVWYRRLYVAFSRYTFINTLRPLSLRRKLA